MELSQIKTKVSIYSKSNKIYIQQAWDVFFFESFLYRLSKSEYSQNFAIKGGFYLQSIVGIQMRSTMDIDLKYIGNRLNENDLKSIFKDICNQNYDNIRYIFLSVHDIAEKSKYGGKSIKIQAQFYNVKKIFSIDIGFDDIITPYPISYNYHSPFCSETYNLFAYPVKTMIAEKFETLISKGVNNSRAKNFFDMYLLNKMKIDNDLLNASIINTFHARGTTYDQKYIENILNDIFTFDRIKDLYNNYCLKHEFTKGISLNDCFSAIINIFHKLTFLEKLNLKNYNVELHLVRHGEDEQNKTGGWSNNHLTEKGVQDVNELCKVIDSSYDFFISSSLKRAEETSLILNKMLNMDIIFNDDFREMNNGLLANLTKEAFKEKYSNLYFSSLDMNEHYPNGESPNEFYYRIKSAFFNLIQNNQNKKILLVTHGGVITIILSIVNGFPYSNKLKLSPQTASITVLR